MSVQTKKRFKNLGRTIGIALFALLMFTNIKIALMDDAELASGDISIFGIELNIFVPSYASTTGSGIGQWVEQYPGGPGGSYMMCCELSFFDECLPGIDDCGWGW